MMWRWIKIGLEFVKKLVAKRTARPQPNAPNEADVGAITEDLRSSAHNIATKLKSEAVIEAKCSPIQKEIEERREVHIDTNSSATQKELTRRREIVRRLFNDFWKFADDRPVTFAERLNQAQPYINQRLIVDGETWQLDDATRKELGLPTARDRLSPANVPRCLH